MFCGCFTVIITKKKRPTPLLKSGGASALEEGFWVGRGLSTHSMIRVLLFCTAPSSRYLRKMSSASARANLKTHIYLNGAWKATEATFPVLESATGNLLADCPKATPADVDAAVTAAAAAFKTWGKTPAAERAAWLK